MNSLASLCKHLHVFFLMLVGLCYDYYRLSGFQFRHFQLYHILRLNIRKLLVHLHELRDIHKFGEPVLHLKAVSRRLNFKL